MRLKHFLIDTYNLLIATRKTRSFKYVIYPLVQKKKKKQNKTKQKQNNTKNSVKFSFDISHQWANRED